VNKEERLDASFQLSYRAEYSSRYHRRRAAFLRQTDSLINVILVVSGASAFGALAGAAPLSIARTAAAFVTILGIIQILFRIGSASNQHSQWLKRWAELGADIRLNTEPNVADIVRWETLKTVLETECVTEFRALVVDCENKASRVMSLQGRQRQIVGLQRFLLHFGTFQSEFPLIGDDGQACPPLLHPDASQIS
jgi:hypothetical protein